MKIHYTVRTDVLVIGGGGAGIKAAVTASQAGAEVLILTKRPFGYSGATFYPGTSGWGMNAIIFEGDSPEYYLEEILEAGAGTADGRLSRVLAEQCTARFHELESYGLEFVKDPKGSYLGVIPCFGKRMRGSATYGIGKIRKTMWNLLMKNNVRIRPHVSVLSLVVRDGVCIGALAFDEMDEPFFVSAKAVILATGGACGIFAYGLATTDQTGDGYVMALDAGARAVNLEFIQFIPGITWPVKKMLFQEKNLDTFPSFTNRYGEDILRKYLPSGITTEDCLIERAKHGPFSTVGIGRYVDIAMYEEWRLGNATDTGGIHLAYDPRVLKDERWVIVKWLEWMRSKNIDVTGRGFDMIPHAQCFNGGIHIDESCGTGVPGLFAAGETAGGAHGADRLGGAAIAATQVFGAIAGSAASAWASGRGSDFSLSDAETQLNLPFKNQQEELIDVGKAMEEVRSIMWECAAIVRSGERCLSGRKRIAELRARFDLGRHLTEGVKVKKAVELKSFLELAEMLLGAIEFRVESRGPHYRIDHPEQDPRLRGMVEIRKGEGGFLYELKKTE